MAGIRDIAKAAGIKAEVVSDVFEAVFQLVRSGEQVRVTGFGSFDRKTFAGRTVQSPVINDGKPTTYGETYRIGFRQSDQAKRRMNLSRKKREREAKAVKRRDRDRDVDVAAARKKKKKKVRK